MCKSPVPESFKCPCKGPIAQSLEFWCKRPLAHPLEFQPLPEPFKCPGKGSVCMQSLWNVRAKKKKKRRRKNENTHSTSAVTRFSVQRTSYTATQIQYKQLICTENNMSLDVVSIQELIQTVGSFSTISVTPRFAVGA